PRRRLRGKCLGRMRRSGTTTQRTDTARRQLPRLRRTRRGRAPAGNPAALRSIRWRPQADEDRRQRKRHLAPEDLRSGHRPLAGEIERDRNRRSKNRRTIRKFRPAKPSVAEQRNTYPVSFRREREQACVGTAGRERCWSVYASCLFAPDKSSTVQSTNFMTSSKR